MDNDEVVNLRKRGIFEGMGDNVLIDITRWHIKMFLYFIALIVFIFFALYFYDKYLAPRNTAK